MVTVIARWQACWVPRQAILESMLYPPFTRQCSAKSIETIMRTRAACERLRLLNISPTSVVF